MASLRPTVDLPAPINPTSTIGWPVQMGGSGGEGAGLCNIEASAIQRTCVSGKSLVVAHFQFVAGCEPMPRSIVALIVVLVVVVALLFGLSRLSHEKPMKHVEKAVPLANLQK
ncbi:hypothetical protein GCM10008023_08020 [Sphingomonas glacialis]|uniref:Uncharacterized protein n=1 Tax=Sphingomonas glacialis TaxID=658225 RepID=A0ABQ3LAG3_9SPHN|nr:hypothetical protein GCM10008023_08020 [Sphingomonas glacialis]